MTTSTRETAFRPLDPARDGDAVARVDTSFTTSAVLRVVPSAAGFDLVETPVDPPRTKRYPVSSQALGNEAYAVIAERGGRVVGVAAVSFEAWNRRAVVSHLYVDVGARGAGVGAGLLDAVEREARTRVARCLWVETQDVNLSALRFYQRRGFTVCGFDTSLYDPREAPGETAVFLVRPLDG